MAAEGIIQYSKEIIDDLKITTNTTYSSDKIEKLLASIPNGNTTEVILGCFDSTNVPTTFVQDDQYYNTTDGKIYKATSSTVWDAGTTPKEDVLYASIADNKIYAYIKNVWGVYGGNTTKISAKTNNIVSDLQGQTNANENGLYVPLSKKSGNVIDNLTGQATDVNNGLFVGKSAKTDNALQKLTGNTNPSEDGLYVEDLNPKINKLNLTTKLNEKGTQEYFYLIGKYEINNVGDFVDNTTSFVCTAKYQIDMLYYMRNEELKTTMDTDRYSFAANGTDLNFGKGGSYITLKAGITYKIKFSVEVYDNISTGGSSVCIFDENGNTVGSRGWAGVSSTTNAPAEAVVKYDKDTKIYFKYKVPSNKLYVYPACSVIMVEAMENVIIDPLQYVDTNNGTQDTPVGTIISLMGKTAPKHYLICDGTEYQIKDYPHLAEYFKKEFGTVNHFGGDGTTTFKVPDLRGEFLRGTGTNSHVNQGNGATVGTHQDATEVAMIQNYQNKTIGVDVGQSGWLSPNFDTAISTAGGRRYQDVGIRTNSTNSNVITTRPTNTSVLWCIKAEPTYFINVIGTTTETELLDTPKTFQLPELSDLTKISLGNGNVTVYGIKLLTDTITLNENIDNYDEIEIIAYGLNETNNEKFNLTHYRIKVEDIIYSDSTTFTDGSMDINFNTVSSTGQRMSQLRFNIKTDKKTIQLVQTTYYNGPGLESKIKVWNGILIKSIKGIKTTSVVQGGNFGGSGSSNPDCDCGTLTPAQIATAITDSETELDK